MQGLLKDEMCTVKKVIDSGAECEVEVKGHGHIITARVMSEDLLPLVDSASFPPTTRLSALLPRDVSGQPSEQISKAMAAMVELARVQQPSAETWEAGRYAFDVRLLLEEYKRLINSTSSEDADFAYRTLSRELLSYRIDIR